jgi:hypothetical protein
LHSFSKISFAGLVLSVVILLGCTPARYRRAADKEVYNIIQEKQGTALKQTNDFTIGTAYSHRKPDDINPQEIIDDRMRDAKQTLTLADALRLAVQNSREYQLEKEDLYISALTLTAERFVYAPQFFAGTKVATERTENGDWPVSLEEIRGGFTKAFKTGGAVSLNLINDFLRFYTGGRTDSAATRIALSLTQPLLRGAGAKVAAERLTQAERNTIYEVRGFSYYQRTFAFDIVRRYLELIRQQDTVKNQYNNFLSRVSLRERSVALSFDRLAPFQADLAVQEELSARDSYILAVERYRTTLDGFKFILGLPAGYEIRLDETVLKELEAVGLLPVPLTDEESFRLALERRPDLLNEIDRFEDSKRQIVVAASALKTDLLLFANTSVASDSTDYMNFDLNDYQFKAGLELDLPLNRKLERNSYRSSIITFERRLRGLSAFLDDVKNDLRADLRTLEQSRQSYDIQNRAKQLADRRVESSELSLQAGRVQVRDVVDAQTARVQAYNAATAALIDYHLTRMRLLLDLGILNTEKERFWLDYGDLPKADGPVAPPVPAANTQLITPEQLFQNDKP